MITSGYGHYHIAEGVCDKAKPKKYVSDWSCPEDYSPVIHKASCLVKSKMNTFNFRKLYIFLAGRRQEASLCRLENELKIALSKSGDFSVASKVCKVSTQSLGQTLSLEHSYRF